MDAFLANIDVTIIHVGNMANKGTQALLTSDVSLIQKIVAGRTSFCVSTTDVDGVKSMKLPVEAIVPPMVDIPYERADFYAKRTGLSRSSPKYKIIALAVLFFMPVQMLLSVLSAVSMKSGLEPIYRGRLLRYMQGSQMVVSYSDENFKETASMLPLNVYWVLTWWSMLVSKTWDVLIAKYLGRPLVLFPNSIGPFRTTIGRTLARLALNRCDRILVREPVSFKIVESLHVKPPRILTVDTVLTLDRVQDQTKIDFSRPTIGVSAGIYSNSLSKKEVERYVEAHAQALDEAIETRGFSVVFLPHYVVGFVTDDLAVSEMILSRMRNKHKAQVINASTLNEFRSLVGQMDIMISSKMHPAVLAVASQVPVVCVAYDHKQTGFFERLKLADCVLPVRDISTRKLLSKIDYVWGERESIRRSLNRDIPVLQAKAIETIRSAIASYVPAVPSEDEKLD